MARQALEEAEEARMGGWVPAWSASEGEDESGEEDGGEEETAATNGDGRRKKGGAREALPVDPRHAARAYEPREDGEKDGLTPDWVIDAGCRVFELNLPTIEAPIIRGLLDPCTNSKRRPNIPAEKTYDKADDGLKQENPWKGFHVILNPSYESSSCSGGSSTAPSTRWSGDFAPGSCWCAGTARTRATSRDCCLSRACSCAATP